MAAGGLGEPPPLPRGACGAWPLKGHVLEACLSALPSPWGARIPSQARCINPGGLWEEPNIPQVWLGSQRAGSWRHVPKVASGGGHAVFSATQAVVQLAPGPGWEEESHRYVTLPHTCSERLETTTW